jgi:hypothetical protein
MKVVLGILAVILFMVYPIARISNDIIFDNNCGEYLKQAADANTVELAKERLKIALNYIELKGLTSGFTSVVYRSPSDDIGFWYNNLKTSYTDLQKVSDTASSLEKSNILMKLRETLLDNGIQLTTPNGISVYPNNPFWAFYGTLTFIFVIIMGVILMVTIFWRFYMCNRF